jgi:hypothetical protein
MQLGQIMKCCSFWLELVAAVLASAGSLGAISANHTSVLKFQTVPASAIQQVRSQYRVFYGHTSHGSQIITGMEMIRSQDTLYRVNEGAGSLSISEYEDDLGSEGDTTWVPITRQKLSEPGNTVNVVVWAWCGGVDASEESINIYLNAMAALEHDYPNVTFVYMTGHLDGLGTGGNVFARNNQIRAYCSLNNKTLFDFADIESYDPDGHYYPDASEACEWCSTWCALHSCPTCSDCAHSNCFNCNIKGKAFWWLLAQLTGWQEGPCCAGTRGNVNRSGIIDLADLSALVSYLTGGGYVLPCTDAANVNGTGIVDLADLSALVSYLTGGGYVLPSCL